MAQIGPFLRDMRCESPETDGSARYWLAGWQEETRGVATESRMRLYLGGTDWLEAVACRVGTCRDFPVRFRNYGISSPVPCIGEVEAFVCRRLTKLFKPVCAKEWGKRSGELVSAASHYLPIGDEK